MSIATVDEVRGCKLIYMLAVVAFMCLTATDINKNAIMLEKKTENPICSTGSRVASLENKRCFGNSGIHKGEIITSATRNIHFIMVTGAYLDDVFRMITR